MIGRQARLTPQGQRSCGSAGHPLPLARPVTAAEAGDQRPWPGVARPSQDHPMPRAVGDTRPPSPESSVSDPASPWSGHGPPTDPDHRPPPDPESPRAGSRAESATRHPLGSLRDHQPVPRSGRNVAGRHRRAQRGARRVPLPRRHRQRSRTRPAGPQRVHQRRGAARDGHPPRSSAPAHPRPVDRRAANPRSGAASTPPHRSTNAPPSEPLRPEPPTSKAFSAPRLTPEPHAVQYSAPRTAAPALRPVVRHSRRLSRLAFRTGAISPTTQFVTPAMARSVSAIPSNRCARSCSARPIASSSPIATSG